MALSITPGYDFGTTEVPRERTVDRWLRYLRVSGVDLGLLDAAINVHLRGEESGLTGSSLAGVGWLWTDPAGNIWVRSNTGPVKLFRTEGGWESNRFHYINADATRAEGYITNQNTSSRATLSLMRFENDVLETGSGNPNLALVQHSAASGDTGVRICFRGGTVIFEFNPGLSDGLFRVTDAPLVTRGQAVAADWTTHLNSASPVSDFTGQAYAGLVLADYPGASFAASLYQAKLFYWHWGPVYVLGEGGVF